MEIITVHSAKASFENENKELTFQDKKCILLVSVGQKYHEGDKLLATIQLINRSHFSVCKIAVADTLQRHNFSDKSPEEAYQYSLSTGDEWLERNHDAISSLAPTVEILRWDEALNDEKYAGLKQPIEKEYRENNFYREEVNSTIELFLDRVRKRDKFADLEALATSCRNYLIEECPIIMPLWASQGYDFIIYPKAMTRAMAATQALFVRPYYENKANWLSLKFKKLATPMNEAVNMEMAIRLRTTNSI